MPLKSIIGFPDYMVGMDGSVWSRRPRNGKGPPTTSYRKLKTTTGKYGHQFVGLRDGVHRVTCRVHRLVLEAFVGQCPEGLEGCHNDGNPANNQVGNLRWDTHTSNEADKIRHGKTNRGERQGHNRLTSSQVLEIRAMKAAGHSRQVVAKRFGVSHGTIYDIDFRKTWFWLEESFPAEPELPAKARSESDVWNAMNQEELAT